MTTKLNSVLALLVILLLTGCSVRKASSAAGSGFPELDLKERLQRETTSGAAPLTALRVARNEKGAELVVPSGIAYSDSGDLYVADNNTHTMHVWRAESPAVAGVEIASDGPRLKFPNAVQTWGGKLFVSDNDGIKIFSPDGRFERLLRTYFEVFNFAVSQKGTIVASTIVRNPDAEDPLIVEMDQAGKVIRRFGSRRVGAGGRDLENQAFITLAENLLFVAFKYRPVVEVYDMISGEMVRSFEVRHPLFAALASEGGRMTAAQDGAAEQNLVPRYVAGVKALGGRIFLCLHFPAPEVWEVNKDGQTLNEFRAEGLPTAIHIFGFDARLVGGKPSFAIGVIDPEWAAAVSELTSVSD